MNNTIEILIDYADSEVSVGISECFLTNKEITTLVSALWEYSWDVEGDFEACNQKDVYWLIFSLPYNPQTSLESVAEELQKKIQHLFPDKIVIIL